MIYEYTVLIAQLDKSIASLVRLMFVYDTPDAHEKLLWSIDAKLDYRLRLMAKRDIYA